MAVTCGTAMQYCSQAAHAILYALSSTYKHKSLMQKGTRWHFEFECTRPCKRRVVRDADYPRRVGARGIRLNARRMRAGCCRLFKSRFLCQIQPAPPPGHHDTVTRAHHALTLFSLLPYSDKPHLGGFVVVIYRTLCSPPPTRDPLLVESSISSHSASEVTAYPIFNEKYLTMI